MRDWPSFFTPLDLVLDFGNKKARRATLQFLLPLAGFALVMAGVLYVVTGHGPTCMIAVEQREPWYRSPVRMKSAAEVNRDERGTGPCANEKANSGLGR